MPPRLSLPSLECWRGTRPIQARNCAPHLNGFDRVTYLLAEAAGTLGTLG